MIFGKKKQTNLKINSKNSIVPPTLKIYIYFLVLVNIEKPSPQLNLPMTKKEKKAYRSECVKRPKIDAPTNTNSYLCENNDSPSVSTYSAQVMLDNS